MTSFYIEKTGSDYILRNKYGVYSKNELEYQLREGHLVVNELGQIYGLKDFQMVHVLRVLDITFRSNLNSTRVYSPTISPIMHQVLSGTLMGDAYMKEPKRYQVAHGVNQIDYLYHIAMELSPFISTVGLGENKIAKFSFLWVHNHYKFIPYFEKHYSQGKRKKFFKKDIINDLDARGLAYWYMDDGKYGKYCAYLCVGDISPEEGGFLIEGLKNKFGLNCTLQAHNKDKGYYNIYIKAESRNKFFTLIYPYIIPSMKYKLKGESPPQVRISRSLILNYHKALCSKEKRLIHFSGLDLPEIQYKNQKELYIEKIRDKIINNKQISKTEFRLIPSKEVLYKMFLEGMTDQQVADYFKFGRNRIAEIRRSMDVPRKKKRK